MITKKLYICLFLLGGILIFTACSPKSDLALLENPDCPQPCWNSIHPGETLDDDAISILEKDRKIDQNSIKRGKATHHMYPDYISWNFNESGYGIISLGENKVKSISLGNVKFSLEDLIDLFGSPGEVAFLPYNGREWRTYILYPKKGIWFSYVKKEDDNKTIDILPEDVVTEVVFVIPNEFTATLEFMGSPFLRNQQLSLQEILQPWMGYGKVKVIWGNEN